MKSMKSPPSGVKLVMAAVCVMRSIPAQRIPDPNDASKKVRCYPQKGVIHRKVLFAEKCYSQKGDIPERCYSQRGVVNIKVLFTER